MRRNNMIFTIDYETWQPLPEGYIIDWRKDLIENANKLMDAFEKNNARITFMVEMCEYFWLLENEKEIAVLVEKQIQDMILRGHDVQLHMHPNWMPESGAKKKEENWDWNWNYASAETYPFDFKELFSKCKNELERIVRKVKKDYRVQAFRAGAYRVQPFDKIYNAMFKEGVTIDTSVYKGGTSKDRGYNFKKCKYYNKPFYAIKSDPQVESNGPSQVVELPITTWSSNKRLFLDNDEAKVFAKRFLYLRKNYFEHEDNFFVMIGHSKGEHLYNEMIKELSILRNYPNTYFTTISESVDKIIKNANKECKVVHKTIKEVSEIMKYLYNNVKPGETTDNDKIYGVLKEKKALCCGYAVTLCSILEQYGYKVKCITATAERMPKGRGARKLDTHELVELKLNGKYYILDPTTNTIIPYKIRQVLKCPELAVNKLIKDQRYITREYYHYDTSFFYERIIYYKKKKVCKYKIGYESTIEQLKRITETYLFHVIPDNIRMYNIYHFKYKKL